MQNLQFNRWIKIRIGEPITSLELKQSILAFGSISGYVGFYDVKANELKYYPEIFEEIIRAIQFKSTTHFYIVIGDFQTILLDVQEKSYITIPYKERTHNAALCSSTMAFLDKNTILMMAVAPTQNKDVVAQIAQKKDQLYTCDITTGNMEVHNVPMPQLYVPFTFNTDSLLYLEYEKNQKKTLFTLNFNTKLQHEIISFPKKVEYVSHCVLIKNLIILVENHKVVKLLNIQNKDMQILYSHDSNIVALEAYEIDQTQNNTIENIKIISLDYYSNVKIYKNKQLSNNFQILKTQGIPQELVKHKYLFDMGYAYYIIHRDNQIVFTTDLGILVFTLP